MCSVSNISSPRSDRRKNRTRRLLRAALFDLMQARKYETITIEDITQAADLGRTTFYLHYKDKDELLLESIEEIAVELKTQIFRAMQQGADGLDGEEMLPGMRPISLVLHYLDTNRSFYLPILRGEGMPRAPERIRHIIEESTHEFFVARMEERDVTSQPDVPLEVVTAYFAVSFLGMITWWLEKEDPHSPEEMARMFREIFFHGARQALFGKTE